MAQILVITGSEIYRVEGDTFHTNKDIGQVIISAKDKDDKLRTVASFCCHSIIGVSYIDNITLD